MYNVHMIFWVVACLWFEIVWYQVLTQNEMFMQREVELDESAAVHVPNSGAGFTALDASDGAERLGSDSRAREGAQVHVASSHP